MNKSLDRPNFGHLGCQAWPAWLEIRSDCIPRKGTGNFLINPVDPFDLIDRIHLICPLAAVEADPITPEATRSPPQHDQLRSRAAHRAALRPSSLITYPTARLQPPPSRPTSTEAAAGRLVSDLIGCLVGAVRLPARANVVQATPL